MAFSIISDITKISKNVKDIDKALCDISGGEIIRYAIIDVDEYSYKISYSYKKDVS